MVSNSLSKRRGPLRRPKVCTTHKNPGRCEPPLPPLLMTCALVPLVAQCWEWMPFLFDLTACDPDSAPDSLVDVVLDGDGGQFVLIAQLLNCRHAFPEFSSGNLGVYHISATSTSLGGSICVATATITVIPM